MLSQQSAIVSTTLALAIGASALLSLACCIVISIICCMGQLLLGMGSGAAHSWALCSNINKIIKDDVRFMHPLEP